MSIPGPRTTPDFWTSSGFHLLDLGDDARLEVSDAYLRAYWQRPEVVPVEESCAAERSLHESLMQDPRRAVTEAEIAAMADPDVRENYRLLLAFRDRLVEAGTLESCYARLFSGEPVIIPPIFVDQMVEAILRRLLDGGDDPFQARAAELFFRDQSVTIQEGQILAGDTQTVEMMAATRGFGDLGKLLVEAGTPSRRVTLDVLNAENATSYWGRSDRHDMVLDLTFARPGLDALSRVLECWVQHFTGAAVSIQPVQQIRDEHWSWHVGLDVTATKLLNDLYQGVEVGDDRLKQLLSLFRLEFKDPNQVRSDLRGKPVYLGLCMDEKSKLRMKPQNLLVNLPLAAEV